MLYINYKYKFFMSKKLSLKFNKSNFSDLVSKLQNLTNIDDTIKIKIDTDNILMYSMIANDVSVLAMKSYQLKTSDYIDDFKNDNMFDFIITSSSKFVKNLKFFTDENQVKFDIVFKPLNDESTMHIRSAQFSNGKLKINCIGGEEYKIRDIKKEALSQRLNINKSKWGFKISKDDFYNVKKLSSINSEDKILNISVIDGTVTMNELGKWELEIDKITYSNTNLVFGKKYLSNINENDEIKFHMFDSFILINDDNSNLMLSFEQSFDDD